MLKKNVETFLECNKTYKEAEIVLFGAPFDSTTSFRPGTRFGSSAIRHESFGLESYSPYQDKDLIDSKMSRPRQHRHLKRKNSILFLVFLDFPHFFIHSGWQDTLF